MKCGKIVVILMDIQSNIIKVWAQAHLKNLKNILATRKLLGSNGMMIIAKIVLIRYLIKNAQTIVRCG